MEKQKNSPALRFSEFTEGWVVKKLGDVATFSKGKGISKADIAEDGITECIRYGELYTFYGETINEIKSKTNIDVKDLVLSEANDVIIPASGETQIDIATASCVLKKGIALGGDLNIIKTKNNGVFLSYYLNSKRKYDIANLAQGISVVHLYSSQLATLNLNLPTLPEQQKIATFFTTIDKKLSGLKEKKNFLTEYKKGVMQQLFLQALRFKNTEDGDFEDWEEKTLREVTTYVDYRGRAPIKKEEGHFLVTAKNIKKGYIDYECSKEYVAENDYTNVMSKGLPKIGDILFTTEAPMGNVAQVDKDNIALAQRVIKFRSKKMLSNLYLLHYMLSDIFQKAISEKAIGTTVQGISGKELHQIKLSFPSLVEQEKIANFLSALDEKIQTVSAQIEKTEAWKKGLLQRMFV